MGEGIVAARRRAGMFGDVADAQVKLEGRREAQRPQQPWGPAIEDQRRGEQHRLYEQEPADCARHRHRAGGVDRRRRHAVLGLSVEGRSGACSARAFRAAFAAQHRPEPDERKAELRGALLEEGLPGQVADHLAPQAGARRRKRLRQRQVGVLGLLGELMVLEVVGAIGEQVRSGRGAGQPLTKEIVHLALRVEQSVRRFVHQDREAELASADEDDREQPADRVLRPGGKPHRGDADDPRMRDEPRPPPRRDARDGRPLRAVEKAVGRQQADGRHGPILTSFAMKRNIVHSGTKSGVSLGRTKDLETPF